MLMSCCGWCCTEQFENITGSLVMGIWHSSSISQDKQSKKKKSFFTERKGGSLSLYIPVSMLIIDFFFSFHYILSFGSSSMQSNWKMACLVAARASCLCCIYLESSRWQGDTSWEVQESFNSLTWLQVQENKACMAAFLYWCFIVYKELHKILKTGVKVAPKRLVSTSSTWYSSKLCADRLQYINF